MPMPSLILSLVVLSPSLLISLAFSPMIGINYGQVANNLPSPEKVIPLLRSIGVNRVKLFDTNPNILRSFAGTDIELTVGLPDPLIPQIRDPATALSWIRSNIKPYLLRTKISAITVGNEVLTSNDSALIQNLLPAMKSVHYALASVGLDRRIAVTTAHSLTVLSSSYPPSAGAFQPGLLTYICPLIHFLNKTRSPFLINAYPFFAYKADPKRVSLDYVLFRPNAGVVDNSTGLRYGNMLHAQVDALLAAVAAAGVERTVEVRVSETGWPSAGDDDEVGASPENARMYNGNLMKMVAGGKGTPMRPESPLQVYVFALFNENLKPGPTSERHYGLFKPDGTPAYDLTASLRAVNSTTGFEKSPPRLTGPMSTGSFHTGTSSASEEGRWLRVHRRRAAVMAAATVTAVASWLMF